MKRRLHKRRRAAKQRKASVPGSLRLAILSRMGRRRCHVLLLGDFSDLGSRSGIGRALTELIREGKLLRIGHGLYTRAVPSIFDGRPVPRIGFRRLTVAALARLGVRAYRTQFELDYQAGRHNQISNGRVVAVKTRISRKIGYDGVFASFERVGSRNVLRMGPKAEALDGRID